MKKLLPLLLLLAAPLGAVEATLCQERAALNRFEFWQVADSPDFGKAFEGVDLEQGKAAEGAWCGYRALYLVNDGGRRQLVRMYKPELSGVFSIIPVTGVRGDGRLIIDNGAERTVRLPELYARLEDMPLPRSYAWADADAATHAESEFYADAELSSRAEAELRNNPELRRELSLVEESELIHRHMDWKVAYIDMDAGHILLALMQEDSVRCLQLSHYEFSRKPDGGVGLDYVASTRFSYNFVDIGTPAFSADFTQFLLPLADEEMNVRTTLHLPACALSTTSEYATGYRDKPDGDGSGPTDALLHELMLGRYGNALLMLRGGKVDLQEPGTDAHSGAPIRPLDIIPEELRATMKAAAGAKAAQS